MQDPKPVPSRFLGLWIIRDKSSRFWPRFWGAKEISFPKSENQLTDFTVLCPVLLIFWLRALVE
jgi:hypothetical protein